MSVQSWLGGLVWQRARSSWQSQAVSLLSQLASSSRASLSASTTWGLSSVFSTVLSSASSAFTWGSGLMNFATTWWVKPLLMVLAIAGAFGAGVVYEARTELQTVLDQSRKEREALASALTTKIAEMSKAAVESALTRSAREKDLAEQNTKLIQEGQNAVTNNAVCLPAAAASALDRMRRQPEAVHK